MTPLVDAMIQAITEQVVKAAVKEAEFVINFRGHFEQMKEGLESMKALLADTKHLKSEYLRIKDALRQLRKVIYEADNALTDCLIRDDQLIQYRKKYYCCFLLSVHLLHDPLFSNRMGKKLTAINSQMRDIKNSLDSYLSAEAAGNGSAHADDHQGLEYKSQDCRPPVTYGLNEDIEMLREWILGSTHGELERIGIVGMGGLGKTTIAQKLFNDSQVFTHFDKMIWVCVSHNFNEKRIVKRMVERSGRIVSKSNVNSMFSTLQKELEDQAYLIVMDDVWPNIKLGWWSDVCYNLPTKVGKPSCIIITTRHEDVANSMVLKSTRIHRPKRLSEDDSWSLFSESAFQRYKGKCPNEQLIYEGRQIVKKCGGLPLAIKTVGSLLASKKNDSLAEWRDTRERFHEIMTTEGIETETVMVSLQLSYDELPNRLKQCLLCVSIYPEDFEIEAEQLIHWWIAEGLIQDKGSKTAVELGYEYVAELVNRCLVEVLKQRGYDGRVYKCKIHDMVRELITKIAEEEALCSFNEQGRLQIQRDDSRWLCFSTDDNIMADEDIDHDHEKPLIKSNPYLRALFLMSSPPVEFGKNFELLESLRLLDLSCSKLDNMIVPAAEETASPGICVEELFCWISCLKRLACLNLSGVQKLKQVPSSIRKLLNLRVLVLNGCINLKRIHPSITSLRRLIVLDLGACSLDYLPQGLGSLSHLQELSGFRVVVQRKACALTELVKLKQLRVLQIIMSDATEISREEMKSLSGLTNLKVLDIDAGECKKEKLIMLDGLKLPPNLQELYLKNYSSAKMPNWFYPTILEKLQYLCIENCDLGSLTDHFNWKIEGLCLKLLNILMVDWEELKNIMPALRYMEISKCPNLKNFPCSVDEPGVWRKKQD